MQFCIVWEVIEEQKRESDPGYSKKMAARPSWLTRIPIAAEQGPTAVYGWFAVALPGEGSFLVAFSLDMLLL